MVRGAWRFSTSCSDPRWPPPTKEPNGSARRRAFLFSAWTPSVPRLSGRGRLVYSGARQPGRLSRPAGRGGIDDRLHTGGGGGHLGGRRCVSVGRAQLAAAHAAVVPCDSRRRYYGELTGRARNRCHILSSDLPLRRNSADRDRHWSVQDARERRPSGSRGEAATRSAGRGGRECVAAAQGVRQRLYRHDRRGGGQQRREGVPRTDRRKGAPYAGG